MNPIQNIERYLPYGYLFLVVMGTIKESVLYYQLGINILKYASITDILMSPIASMTSHPIILGTVLLTLYMAFLLPKRMETQIGKAWVKKLLEVKDLDAMSKEEIQERIAKKSVQFTAVMLICVFLGMGLGEGFSLGRRIQKSNLKIRYTLNLVSGEKEEIELLNTNSQYYFFVSKGSTKVQIAPISSVKILEITHNRMLD